MTAYIIKRLIQALVVLVLTTMVLFIIIRLLPGDPVLIYMTQSEFSTATPERVDAVRHEFGLDKSIVEQYLFWISDLLHGDLGDSIVKRRPVNDAIMDALPITLHLGILAFILSTIISIPVGIICAVRRGTWIDTVLTVLANIGITAPPFWVAIMLIYVISYLLGWLPISGYTSPFDDFWLSTKQSILPIFCISLFPLAATVRQTRSAMLEVISQDYIRTAWSKGLGEQAIIFRHAVKNGISPVVTLIGINLGHIVGGSVLVENVFSIPGIGQLSVDALFNRDYAVILGIILMVATAVVLTNLIVDISYCWLDPRIRYE